MGIHENYPHWFKEVLYNQISFDGTNLIWVDIRNPHSGYRHVVLYEDVSVFIRNKKGDIFVTDYTIFNTLYEEFKWDRFENSGLAALREDCIDFVECIGGGVIGEYPDWFYEFFTEYIVFPSDSTSIFIKGLDGEFTVTHHMVFLRNRFGEIMTLGYDEFIKIYDPNPGY